MATLPTIPGFSYQETPTISKLNQLVSAVSFVTQVPIVASLKRSTDQAVAASTTTAVQWNVEEVDSDGMHDNVTNPSRLTCQTQGYYRIHATIALTNNPAAVEYQAWFQQTTGSNNPLGAAHTQVFGGEASFSSANTSDSIALSIRSLTPCLYVNDYVEVFVNAGQAANVRHDYRVSGNADNAGFGDGASCLYAYYCFEGP